MRECDDPDSWRQQRYEHEVRAVEKTAELIQRTEQTLRLVRSSRAIALGLVVSPFVGASSALQGVRVGMVRDNSRKGNECQEQGGAMHIG